MRFLLFGLLFLIQAAYSLERSEAHKYYCGLNIKDFKKMNIITCERPDKKKLEGKEGELSKDIDEIISQVKETTILDYCKDISKKNTNSISTYLVSDISPLPNGKCICNLNKSIYFKQLCNPELELAQIKDTITKSVIENFDEYQRDSITKIQSIKGAACDLSKYSYCHEKFENKEIKSNFMKENFRFNESVDMNPTRSASRIDEIVKKYDSLDDFILKVTNGDIIKKNAIANSLCNFNSDYPKEIQQLQYDLTTIFSNVNLNCSNSHEINGKNNFIRELLSNAFKNKKIETSNLVTQKSAEICQGIQDTLDNFCSPSSDISNLLNSITSVNMIDVINDQKIKSISSQLSCLYPIKQDIAKDTKARKKKDDEIAKNIKDAEEIISDAKEIISKGNLSAEEKSKIKGIENRLKNLYGVSFNLFNDSQKNITDKIKASIYKKEIQRRKEELAKLKDEVKNGKNMTSFDKTRAKKKIQQLSKTPSQENFFSSASKTAYTPSYGTTPGSFAEEKFSFPTFDIDDHSSRPSTQETLDSDNTVTQESSGDNRSTASTGSNKTLTSNTDSNFSSGVVAHAGSILSPSLISLQNYNSIKNYNVPTRKQEKEALYDGQDPEVKAVFLQDEKLMRLFRYKEDKYELEEEFDARKFYANINQFDNKTKELGVIFFKRYAVNDLNAILKN